MPNVLVTGSSRGLGLELVKQLASHSFTKGSLIIAAGRKCSPELHEVVSSAKGAVVFVTLDVTNEETVAQSAETVALALGDRSMDLLTNCAGVHGETHGKVALMSDLDYQLSVNVTGTHNVLRQYLPLMQKSQLKKVVSISSVFGSLTNAREVVYAPCPAYKISKTALNALTVQYALSYEAEGFVFIALNPGWLQTEMGGQDADLTLPQGAEAVLKTVMAATGRDNGCFKNVYVPGWEKKYDRQDLPW
ncbi:hydroxyacyl dehydrogenase [Aspergillus desertorum]